MKKSKIRYPKRSIKSRMGILNSRYHYDSKNNEFIQLFLYSNYESYRYKNIKI
jgi:hypothetical protein